MNKELKDHLIIKYRESITQRYDYDTIKNDPNLPMSFTRETVDEMRNFFLDNLYSMPKEREKLDAAFKQLESYVSNPAKVWGLLGNVAAAIFEFGFHFPSALRTGIVSLQTHTSARNFEANLLQAAVDRKYKAPLTEAQFHECLAALPKEQVNTFIDELTELFKSISDTTLLEKTIHILKNVLKRMGEKKDLYGPDDRSAIQLGINILNKGYKLLSQYDETTKKDIVEYITYSETKFLDSLGKGKK